MPITGPQSVTEMTVQPNWTKHQCPWCHNIIYLDDTNKRTLHKEPMCPEYTNFVSGAKCEGRVNLNEGHRSQ